MKASTRFITSTALFTAILIAVQFALSGVAGVELVTVIFLAFCYCAGQRAGLTVGICFSLLRCFLFGFYPTVVVLYLIYYPSFALFFGFLGKKFGQDISIYRYIAIIGLATLFTILFTLLDDVVTPLMFGFNKTAMLSYFYASVPFMIAQSVCTLISVALLFKPLAKVFSIAKLNNL